MFRKFIQKTAKVFNKYSLVAVALLGVLTISGTVLAGFGPDRPTKAYSPGIAGFDHVTFNSFTGVPNFGDERAFYNGQYQDQAGTYYDPLTQVRDGDVINMHIYIHNNADSSLNASGVGIAKNVTVDVDLPQGIPAVNHTSMTTISSSNASPVSIFDTVDFSAENGGFFELDYVEGSAKLVGNGINQPLSDNLVSGGVSLPNIFGCFQYAVAVTFQVEIDMPSYEVQKEVRMFGESSNDWAESKTVNPGDTVQWLVEFKNTGSTVLEDVKVIDTLPDHLTVVPGSVKQFDTSGVSNFPDTVIQDGGTLVNANVGDMNPGSNVFVMFDTVVDEFIEECGGLRLINRVATYPGEGLGQIGDDAQIEVNLEECEENVVFQCSGVNITKLGGRKISVTVNTVTSPSNKVSVTGYRYNFGDGTIVNSTSNIATYTYAKDSQYTVDVTVDFDVEIDGQVVEKQDVCSANVAFNPPELPNTGPVSFVATLFGTGTLGSAIRGWLKSRKDLLAIG